jgi:cytoskeletal protein CcmA (bactofilin family)
MDFPQGVSMNRTLFSMLLCALLAPAAAQAPERENRYLAGGSVVLDEAVRGDVYAAGGNVRLGQPVDGDAVVAGGSVTVSAKVGDDLRAAGGSVTINTEVGGELMLAGGSVSVGPQAVVGGALRAAAGSIDIDAKVAQKVQIAAQSVRLAGEYGGDVEVAGERIRVEAGTTIAGNLRWTGSQPPNIDPGATIAGKVIEWKSAPQLPMPDHQDVRRGLAIMGGVFLFGVLAAGLLMLWIAPGWTFASGQALRESPGLALLIGVAAVCAIPPLAIVLMITVAGLPVAILLLLLYPLLLALGYLIAAGSIGDRLALLVKSDMPGLILRSIGLLLGIVLLAAVALIPYAGWLLVLLAVLLGAGAVVLEATRRRRGV